MSGIILGKWKKEEKIEQGQTLLSDELLAKILSVFDR